MIVTYNDRIKIGKALVSLSDQALNADSDLSKVSAYALFAGYTLFLKDFDIISGIERENLLNALHERIL